MNASTKSRFIRMAKYSWNINEIGGWRNPALFFLCLKTYAVTKILIKENSVKYKNSHNWSSGEISAGLFFCSRFESLIYWATKILGLEEYGSNT